MERPADLSQESLGRQEAPMRGQIRQLTYYSAGADIPSHLAPGHNGVGYGFISIPAGEVFFDASAIANMRFDQLSRNMTVEFTLDQAPSLRTSRIVVVNPLAKSSHDVH